MQPAIAPTTADSTRTHHRHRVGPMLVSAVIGAALLVACGGADESGDDASAADDAETTDVTDISLVEADTVDSPDKPTVDIPAEPPTELVITDLVDGDGPAAAAGDTVFVDYIGVRSEDGTEFDNSYDRGEPFPVTLGAGQVIEGWDTGLIGARTGGRRQLDIPADLAYGDRGAGDVIRAGDALSFVVDVRAVVPAVTADDAPSDLTLEPSVEAEEVGVVDATVGDGAALEQGDIGIFHLRLHRGADLELLLDTWEQGSPQQIAVIDGATLPGLVEGLTGMRVGGVRVLSIPSADAWDGQGNEALGVGPGEDLVMVAELFGRL